ncbi:hypothetical protein SAMN05216516_11221 [Izhakiella capsodis]|uniref:Uncharacterized protein n=1 Tax=Izhakiella capsodis TaxID=1367852 RepID=A0A1I5AIB4_9GAMM|nr:hypothetical protein SAMN05216516_11221 [Izhakiella capsodis]
MYCTEKLVIRFNYFNSNYIEQVLDMGCKTNV